MSRLLIIDTSSNCLDFAIRCMDAGHKVKVYDRPRKDNTPRRSGQGIIDKITDYNELRRKWVDWADVIYAPDNVAYVDLLDSLIQQGYPVFAGGLEAAKMELDREHGQKLMKDHGIPIMESVSFHDYDAAIEYVKKHPHMLVSKPSGDANKALSYVANNAGDMVYMLQRWKGREDLRAAARAEGFILQEKKVGIEMAVGSWYGPGGWSKWAYENWENKKLMNGDLGVATGEMGTVTRPVLRSKLADEVLYPIEPYLKKIGYVGYIDNNCIIDDEGCPWPMEWTMRDGWPLRHNVIAQMKGDPLQWMLDLLHGRDTIEFEDGQVCISVVMAIPDFPYSRLTNKEVCGIPVYGAADDPEHIHPSEIMMGMAPVEIDGKVVEMPHWVTSGDYVLICTGTGDTISGARRSAYSAIKKVKVPNSPFYRTDIGHGRLVKQLPQLKALGYGVGLEM
jgi:phosphoribosylamine--glycine ligase